MLGTAIGPGYLELERDHHPSETVSRGRDVAAAMDPCHLREGISLEGVEKDLIIRAMKKFEGNQSQAAI